VNLWTSVHDSPFLLRSRLQLGVILDLIDDAATHIVHNRIAS
jgi:hypothetical protein